MKPLRTVTDLDIKLGLFKLDDEQIQYIKDHVVPNLARKAIKLIQEGGPVVADKVAVGQQ